MDVLENEIMYNYGSYNCLKPYGQCYIENINKIFIYFYKFYINKI